jgi:tetraacyldisaccharide 4'-kinase
MPTDNLNPRLRRLSETRGEGRSDFFALLPLSLVYGALVRLRERLYRWGLFPTRRLPIKVVCVGNLTTGGTGKTPMVEYVARMLHDAGKRVAVLSRGYKGTKERRGGVVCDGEAMILSPRESGDEPYMLALRLGRIPVLVGRNRYASGNVVYRRFDTEIAVLDDGYQHFQLARDLNIVLVDGRKGFGNGHLLPLGTLREPLAGLRRADHFVITKVEQKEAVQTIEKTLQAWNPGAQIFHARYVPQSLLDPMTGERSRPDDLRGKTILAFAGLASPAYFFELLRSLGASVREELIFPDHHCYTEGDVKDIREMTAGAEWAVTTEKDMVRLRDMNIENLPIRVLEIRMDIADEERFKTSLLRDLAIQDTAASGRRE